VSLLTEAFAFQQAGQSAVAKFDKRTIPLVQESTAPDGKAAAVAELRKRLPNVRVDFTQSPIAQDDYE